MLDIRLQIFQFHFQKHIEWTRCCKSTSILWISNIFQNQLELRIITLAHISTYARPIWYTTWLHTKCICALYTHASAWESERVGENQWADDNIVTRYALVSGINRLNGLCISTFKLDKLAYSYQQKYRTEILLRRGKINAHNVGLFVWLLPFFKVWDRKRCKSLHNGGIVYVSIVHASIRWNLLPFWSIRHGYKNGHKYERYTPTKRTDRLIGEHRVCITALSP